MSMLSIIFFTLDTETGLSLRIFYDEPVSPSTCTLISTLISTPLDLLVINTPEIILVVSSIL